MTVTLKVLSQVELQPIRRRHVASLSAAFRGSVTIVTVVTTENHGSEAKDDAAFRGSHCYQQEKAGKTRRRHHDNMMSRVRPDRSIRACVCLHVSAGVRWLL